MTKVMTNNNKRFHVYGNVSFKNTQIVSLPDDFEVTGNLCLRGASIFSLPNYLEIGGNLDIRNTDIKWLPKNMRIKGHFLLNDSISRLPDGLSVGKEFLLDIDGVLFCADVNDEKCVVNSGNVFVADEYDVGDKFDNDC